MISGLYGAYATLLALREIESKGGAGQVIDLSLLEANALGSGLGCRRVQGLRRRAAPTG